LKPSLLTLFAIFLICGSSIPQTADNQQYTASIELGKQRYRSGQLDSAIQTFANLSTHLDIKGQKDQYLKAKFHQLRFMAKSPVHEVNDSMVTNVKAAIEPSTSHRSAKAIKALVYESKTIEDKSKAIEASIKKLTQALQNNPNLPSNHLKAWVMVQNQLHSLKKQKNQLDQAQSHLDKALDTCLNKKSCKGIEFDLLNNKAHLMLVKGHYDSSNYYAHQSLQKGQSLYQPLHPNFASVYRIKGQTSKHDRNYEKSAAYYDTAIRILKRHQIAHSGLGATVYKNIGYVYSKSLRLKKAMNYTQKALSIRLDVDPENYNGLSNIYLTMATTSKLMNKNNEGLKFNNKALDLANKCSGHRELRSKLTIFNNRANLLRELQRYEEGKQVVQKGLRIAKKLYDKTHPYNGMFYMNLVALNLKQGHVDSASHFLDSSIKVYQNIYPSDHPVMGFRSKTTKGLVNYKQGNLQKAIGNLQAAYQIYAPRFKDTTYAGFPSTRNISHALFAYRNTTIKGKVLKELYQKSQDPKYLKASLRAYATSDSLIKRIQEKYYLKDDQSVLAKEALEVYPYAVETCYQLKNQSQGNSQDLLSKAFYYAEKGKTITLLKSLSKARTKFSRNLPDSFRSKLQSYDQRIAKLERKIHNADDSLERLDLKNEQVTVTSKKEQVFESIQAEYPSFYSMSFSRKVIPLSKLQSKLEDQNKNMVEYIYQDSLLYALTVTSNNAALTKLTYKDSLAPSIKRFRSGIIASKDFNRQKARQFYHDLFKPIERHLTTEQIVVIPDGMLSYLPFESFLKNDKNKEHYLIQDYQFSYSPSATLWGLWDQKKRSLPAAEERSTKTFTGFAPDFSQYQNNNEKLEKGGNSESLTQMELDRIPLAKKEVKYCAEQLYGNAFIGNKATELQFKKTAHHSNIIHLATHGIMDDQKPAYNKLLFQTDSTSEQDGSLHTYELYNQNLKADLAVLSACNTGYGTLKQGQGIMSLARGFKMAGCQNILMTLWDINDRVSFEMMQDFYKNLNNGKDKSEALRQAKLDYIKSSDQTGSNPYYWASFVMMGSDAGIPSYQKGFSYIWTFSIIGIVLIVLGGFILYRKKAKG